MVSSGMGEVPPRAGVPRNILDWWSSESLIGYPRAQPSPCLHELHSPVKETDLSPDNPESAGLRLGCHLSPAWEGVKESFLEEGLSKLDLEDEEAVRKESSPGG